MAAVRTVSLDRPRIDFDASLPRAAIAAGLVAGSAALLLMQWMSTIAYDESAWNLPRMIAAIVAGPGALGDDADAPLAALGCAVHFALSFAYALMLGYVLRGTRREHAPIVGIAFGLVLYYANLHAFAAFFPWFAELRTPDTLGAHVVFGIVAACALNESGRPPLGEDG